MQNDEIFWICKPEEEETLSQRQRILVTLTFILLKLLIQTYWAQIVSKEATHAKDSVLNATNHNAAVNFVGTLLLKIISTDIIVRIIGLFYKPIMRVVMTKEDCWAGAESKIKVYAGKIISLISGIVCVIIFIFIFIGMSDLLKIFSCEDFLMAVFLPFVGAIIWGSLFPGIFTSYLVFVLKNTFGKKDREDSEAEIGLMVDQD